MPERTPIWKGYRGAPTSAEAERRRFYGSQRWKDLRIRVLRRKPLCEPCERQGIVTPANTVHHKIDRLKRPDLAYTVSNLESVCSSCHSHHHNRERK